MFILFIIFYYQVPYYPSSVTELSASSPEVPQRTQHISHGGDNRSLQLMIYQTSLTLSLL